MNKQHLVDLPEEKTESERNRFSLTQLMHLVEFAPICVSITDSSGTILYVNQQFKTTTGYKSSELIGQKHSVISYKTTPKRVYKHLWKTITKGKSWQGRLVNRRKNGERYLAEVNIAPLDNERGEQCYFMGSHRDISETHAEQTELQNQIALFVSVLNTVPSAVALLNPNQEVVLDNLAYKTLLTDFGTEPMPLVLAELKQQLNLSAKERVQASHFPEGRELSIELTINQKSRWFRCRFLTLEMRNDDVDAYFKPTGSLHTLVVIKEFTKEHRQREAKRIAQLHAALLESESLHIIQEAMHAVVHQLQGPVNTIDSALQMIRQRGDLNASIEPMTLAFNAGEKALDTLRHSLPERPKEARQSVNLNQFIHELTLMLSESLQKQGIDLQLNLLGTLPSCNAQPFRLRVAMKQLIDNAIEAIVYSKSEKRLIKLSTDLQNGEFIFQVDDSGPGMAKEDRLKIFEPFFTTKPEYVTGARGMGLSVVQQIVNEHQARLDIQPSPLGGSQFCLKLPRLQEAR